MPRRHHWLRPQSKRVRRPPTCPKRSVSRREPRSGGDRRSRHLNFNPDARAACEWTAKALSNDSREFLRSLQPSHSVDGIQLAHGSPRDPIFEYIFNLSIAVLNFDRFDSDVCLVGHTHVSLIFTRQQATDGPPQHETAIPEPSTPFALKGRKSIVNPGSVGQPRDGDPNAAYMIFDQKNFTVTLKRQAYDVAKTQQLMRQAQLPARLVQRLSHGW